MYQSCYLPETEIYIPTTCHEVLSHLNVKYTSVLKRQEKKKKKKNNQENSPVSMNGCQRMILKICSTNAKKGTTLLPSWQNLKAWNAMAQKKSDLHSFFSHLYKTMQILLHTKCPQAFLFLVFFRVIGIVNMQKPYSLFRCTQETIFLFSPGNIKLAKLYHFNFN